MSLVIGVHGIAQQQLGRNQLIPSWQRALADGMERALEGKKVGLPPLDVAFYGDVFLAAPRSGKRIADPDEQQLKSLTDEDLTDEDIAALEEALSEEDLAQVDLAEEALKAKGRTRTPQWIQAALGALDRRFGASAGVLYIGELRQVRRYLHDKRVKERVDEVVANAVGEDCRVLIGHSLGAVVAWEYVRQNPSRPIGLLLTLVSPLGLRMVRSRLLGLDNGTGRRPSQVGNWVNVRDPRDPVTCAGDLGQWFSGVSDKRVDNDTDAHAVGRYLGKSESGRAVLDVAPHLADL